MTSTIITGGTEEKRKRYIVSWCEKEVIAPVDQRFITLEVGEEKGAKQSIGIDAIKIMRSQLYLTPVQSKRKAVIILQAETLTVEAQNALLKVLEEPPVHTVFFLSTISVESLLPTIRSRCTVVRLDEEVKQLSDTEKTSLKHILQEISTHSVKHPFELGESFGKTKDNAKASLENLLMVLQDELREGNFSDPEVLRSVMETYKKISMTNASHRLLLEALFLKFTPNG